MQHNCQHKQIMNSPVMCKVLQDLVILMFPKGREIIMSVTMTCCFHRHAAFKSIKLTLTQRSHAAVSGKEHKI